MKLLLLTPEFPPTFGGGIATFYRDLAPGLARKGIDVRIVVGSCVSTAATEERRTDAHGLRVDHLGQSRFRKHMRGFSRYGAIPTLQRHLAAASAMWELAQEGPSFDIVEASDWGLLPIPPIMANEHPVVAQLHASVGQISRIESQADDDAANEVIRLLEHTALSRAAALQSYSDGNCAFWQRELNRNVTMIRPMFRQVAVTSPESVVSTAVVLGRIQNWKGPEVLCQALDLLGEDAPSVDWYGRDMSSGSGETSVGGVLSLRYPAIWGQKIKAHLPVSPTDAFRKQASALFNIVPSDWDVFNFTAVEALLSGRPTIVSDGAGAAELIDHGHSGLIFEAKNPKSLAAAIQRATDMSEHERLIMSNAASKAVEGKMSPASVIDQRIHAYHAVLEGWHTGNRCGPPSRWITDACSAGPAVDPFLFLNQMPMKPILQLLLKRLKRKVRRGF